MKKTLSLFALVAGLFAVSAVSAYAAVPVVNGSISPVTEWDNTGYNYYLNISDANEAGIPDQYDIKSATLLQELEGFGFGDGNAANDGIYLLIETYSSPSFVEETIGGATVSVYLDGDFDGNGTIDFSLVHTANANGTIQSVNVTFNVFGPTGNLTALGGSFAVGSVLEYYIPSGPFNTPHFPFPGTFTGYIQYDNGGLSPDDIAIGRLLVPEPSSMLLFGGALLGLLGANFKRFSK